MAFAPLVSSIELAPMPSQEAPKQCGHTEGKRVVSFAEGRAAQKRSCAQPSMKEMEIFSSQTWLWLFLAFYFSPPLPLPFRKAFKLAPLNAGTPRKDAQPRTESDGAILVRFRCLWILLLTKTRKGNTFSGSMTTAKSPIHQRFGLIANHC